MQLMVIIEIRSWTLSKSHFFLFTVRKLRFQEDTRSGVPRAAFPDAAAPWHSSPRAIAWGRVRGLCPSFWKLTCSSTFSNVYGSRRARPLLQGFLGGNLPWWQDEAVASKRDLQPELGTWKERRRVWIQVASGTEEPEEGASLSAHEASSRFLFCSFVFSHSVIFDDLLSPHHLCAGVSVFVPE